MKKVDFFLSLRFPSPRARVVSFESRSSLFLFFFFFFFLFPSERNLSKGRYSVARYERGTVNRIDRGNRPETRMLNSKSIIK